MAGQRLQAEPLEHDEQIYIEFFLVLGTLWDLRFPEGSFDKMIPN